MSIDKAMLRTLFIFAFTFISLGSYAQHAVGVSFGVSSSRVYRSDLFLKKYSNDNTYEPGRNVTFNYSYRFEKVLLSLDVSRSRQNYRTDIAGFSTLSHGPEVLFPSWKQKLNYTLDQTLVSGTCVLPFVNRPQVVFGFKTGLFYGNNQNERASGTRTTYSPNSDFVHIPSATGLDNVATEDFNQHFYGMQFGLTFVSSINKIQIFTEASSMKDLTALYRPNFRDIRTQPLRILRFQVGVGYSF